jgi:hypothetical protein
MRTRVKQPPPCGSPARRWDRIAAVTLLAAGWAAFAQVADLAPETRGVLIEAVEAATALDLYNARCRSDGSGRNSDNLNKQLATKLHLTIVGVQDEVFPERSFRAVQRRLQEQFTEELRAAGGCQGAKDAGMAQQLNARYREGIAAVEALP